MEVSIVMGVPLVIIHFHGRFSQKPTSFWGTPMAMESPILTLVHLANLQLIAWKAASWSWCTNTSSSKFCHSGSCSSRRQFHRKPSRSRPSFVDENGRNRNHDEIMMTRFSERRKKSSNMTTMLSWTVSARKAWENQKTVDDDRYEFYAKQQKWLPCVATWQIRKVAHKQSMRLCHAELLCISNGGTIIT